MIYTQLIREQNEGSEKLLLSLYGTKSVDSLGRLHPDTPCGIRTVFQRDRDRILHSKAFRRLKHKTQVFISPVGDHYRTRLTHSLEVAQIARTMARALKLNEDLTECIALGHDLGHPPFGHAGENVLNVLSPTGFHHPEHSVKIATELEPLNLSLEALYGMAAQSNNIPAWLADRFSNHPHPVLEAKVVELADRMAYLHHDIEDATRAGVVTEADIPKAILATLGATRQERLDTLVLDLVYETLKHFEAGDPQICLSTEKWEAMMALRQWMFENVYFSPCQSDQSQKVARILTGLYEYYEAHPKERPEHFSTLDYVAGMTDRYALEHYQQCYFPSSVH